LAQISPDGTKIALALRTGPESAIWLHSLESGEWRRMTPPGMNAIHPFWAPNSEEFGFSTHRAMRRMRVDGSGGPQIIAELPSVYNSASWSETGKILFSSAPQAGLMVVPASGGKPVQVTQRSSPGENWHYSPEFLPGTKDEFLYTSVASNRPESKVYLSSLARPAERKQLLVAPSNVSYFSAAGQDRGYLVYQGPGNLMAVQFDVRAKQLVGAPVSVGPLAAFDVSRAYADFSVSRKNGDLIYRTGTGFQKRRLRLVDPSGKLLESSESEGLFRFPAWSPDGNSIAVGITDPQTGTESIWIFDSRLRNPRKFSRGAVAELAPIWSPDSTWIAFVRGTNIFAGSVSGIGPVRQITSTGTPKITTSWSPDGSRIIFTEYIRGMQQDIRSIEVNGKSAEANLTTDPGNESEGQVSPDGKYLLYEADTNGHRHVFVERLPIDPSHREPVQLSITESYAPRWTKGGAEVVFVIGNKQLVAVSLRDRMVRLQYETPTWFHRGYGYSCHPAKLICVLSAPGEDPYIAPPVVAIHATWPNLSGR
jgi:Tol biopolymer transport system component